MLKPKQKYTLQENQRTTDDIIDVNEIVDKYLGSEEDVLCGVGSCRGGAFQFLSHPLVYLVASSLISLVQGLFYTYSNATLSTVEKDFGLPSKLSGLTTTGNDVIQLLLAIPLPFFASRGHRPRWLAFGMLLSTFGCLVAVLPHFVLPSHKGVDAFVPGSRIGQEKVALNESSSCNTRNISSSKKCVIASLPYDYTSVGVVSLLLLAQVLAGVASLLYYTIGYSYLDEAVSKEKVPLFLSISGAMRVLGPVCGYSLASWALSIWKIPSRRSNVSLTPLHPRWVGAWWLGYIVIGCVLLSICWVLVLMPKTLPDTRRRKLRELREAATKGSLALRSHLNSLRPQRARRWREMLPCLVRLSKNSVYRLVVLKEVFFWFAFFTYVTFKSKYLEHQFRLSAAEANRYIAVVSLVAACIGWVGTGATLSFIRPKTRTIILYMAILSSVSCLGHLGQMHIECHHPAIEGLDKAIQHRKGVRMDGSCEVECGCVSEPFSPVCRENNSTFFNYCFETCFNQRLSKGKASSAWEGARGTKGFCSPTCPSFLMYLIISLVVKMVHAASCVPINILLFRCAEERDKDMGLGIFNAMICLGASIPAPILVGWAIDRGCILWDKSCDATSVCWLYDVKYFRKIIHGIPAVFLALCVVMDLLLLRHHHGLELYPPRNSGGKNGEKNGGKDREDATEYPLVG